jgi:hypothetical protein
MKIRVKALVQHLSGVQSLEGSTRGALPAVLLASKRPLLRQNGPPGNTFCFAENRVNLKIYEKSK